MTVRKGKNTHHQPLVKILKADTIAPSKTSSYSGSPVYFPS